MTVSVQKENTNNIDIVQEDGDLQFISMAEPVMELKEKEMKFHKRAINEKKKSRKLKKNVKRNILVLLGVIGVLYIGLSIFFMKHYYPGTIINDVDYTGNTPQGVTAKVLEMVNVYELEIVGRDGLTDSIKGQDIGLQYQFDDTLTEIAKQQNGWLWFIALFKDYSYELPKMATYDQMALNSKIDQLVFFDKSNIVKPQNAYISDYSEETGYTLVEEIKGSTLDKEKTKQAVKEAMSRVDEELDLDIADCYVEPTVTKENESLRAVYDKLKLYTSVTITYDFEIAKEEITGQQIYEWLSYDAKTVSIDEEKARECVNSIARKYDTFGKNRKFKTISGNEIELLSGWYGWRVDRAAETEQLIADIKAGKSITREMIYSSEGYVRKDNGEGGVDDIGDTYVEINLGEQHLYVIQNGSVVEQSDFVSGNISKGNGTPPGVFGITYKEKNAVLKGEDYESDVNYWMPFNGNIGMHDATWRKEFGGEIYKTRGSHGCVNLPLEKAEIIYSLVEKGMPVVCYY